MTAYWFLFASEYSGCQHDYVTLRLSYTTIRYDDDEDNFTLLHRLGTPRKRGLSAGVELFLSAYINLLLTSEVGEPRPLIGVALHWVSNHMSGPVCKDVVCGLTRLILFHRAMVNDILCSYD